MANVTGEIRELTVRLVVIDHDQPEVIQEAIVSSVDVIDPDMIKSVSDHLVKKVVAQVKVDRTRPINRAQLTLAGVERMKEATS